MSGNSLSKMLLNKMKAHISGEGGRVVVGELWVFVFDFLKIQFT